MRLNVFLSSILVAGTTAYEVEFVPFFILITVE